MSPAASADHVLAIDCGTQSLRALVVGPTGEIVAKVRVPFEPYVSPHPGWAEQDPEIWWRALGEATRRVLADPDVRVDAIAGVTLTTQRASVVVVDAAGDPLRPAITWLDQRRTEGLPPVGGLTGLAFRALRVSETVAAFQADAEVNWIRRHEPEVWAKTAGYLLVSGFLTRRLVGRNVDSVGCQVGYLPFDYRRLRWSAPSDWKWQVAPVDRAMLPELVPPAGRLGEISAEAAATTGIPVGLPLIAAAADKACEVLGAGALDPSIGAISFGTTATFNTTHRRYVEAIPMIPPYPAAVPGAYSLEINVMRGYWMVEWFKREFGDREVARAADEGVAPGGPLRRAGPGRPGRVDGAHPPAVLVTGCPDPRTRGEGGDHRLGRRPHPRPPLPGDPRGPGLRPARGCRTDREAGRGHHPGAPGLRWRVPEPGGGADDGRCLRVADGTTAHLRDLGMGAAIDAAIGLGIHPSFDAAIAAMTRLAEVRDPDPATHRVYDELYRDVYRKMYPALRPLYASIRRITGYPGSP